MPHTRTGRGTHATPHAAGHRRSGSIGRSASGSALHSTRTASSPTRGRASSPIAPSGRASSSSRGGRLPMSRSAGHLPALDGRAGAHTPSSSLGSATDTLTAIAAASSIPVSTAPTKVRVRLAPFLILGGVVLASAIQTETASYMASRYKFDQPYFSFFITHATFTLVFPIHVLMLALFSPAPRSLPGKPKAHGVRGRARTLLRNLRAVLGDQLRTAPRWRVLWRPLAAKILPLTLLISVPAICWFVAMAFSPAMDITALYATSAFHAYFFSLLLLGTRLTRTTVAAIAVAFFGVLVLTLDGAKGGGGDTKRTGTRRVIGDIIMVIGAALLGLYEVVYKMVLPEGEGGRDPSHSRAGSRSSSVVYTAVNIDESDEDEIALSPPPVPRVNTPLLPKAPSRPTSPTLTGSSLHHINTHIASEIPHLPPPLPLNEIHIPVLPTALHSNFLTSLIGFATFVLLWPPFPILHWTGIEEFQLPANGKVWALMAVVAVGGAIYNAGLMTLIGIWGPTTSSVANLLTIGLVAIADAVWMGLAPDLQTMAGAGMICAGFGVLLWEGEEE